MPCLVCRCRGKPKTTKPNDGPSIYQHLSELQSAYSVFIPKPEELFPLFQIIKLQSDRSKSPRNTTANLREMFIGIEELNPRRSENLLNKIVNLAKRVLGSESTKQSGLDEAVMKKFLKEFAKSSPPVTLQTSKPSSVRVSVNSLQAVGLKVSEPSIGVNLGFRPLRVRSTHCLLSLSPISSVFYTGTKLKDLIWDHSDFIFVLILKHLETDLAVRRNDDMSSINRSLLGIVTKRMVSNIDLSWIEEKDLKAGAGATVHGVGLEGIARRKVGREQIFRNLKGVSGLHFILFPVEYMERYEWRLYQGIDVCDCEQGEDASENILQRDNLIQATRWQSGQGTLNHADDFKTIRTSETV